VDRQLSRQLDIPDSRKNPLPGRAFQARLRLLDLRRHEHSRRLVVWKFVPETKGRSLEQMEECLVTNISVIAHLQLSSKGVVSGDRWDVKAKL
jgi:hypothetical protein